MFHPTTLALADRLEGSSGCVCLGARVFFLRLRFVAVSCNNVQVSTPPLLLASLMYTVRPDCCVISSLFACCRAIPCLRAEPSLLYSLTV